MLVRMALGQSALVWRGRQFPWAVGWWGRMIISGVLLSEFLDPKSKGQSQKTKGNKKRPKTQTSDFTRI